MNATETHSLQPIAYGPIYGMARYESVPRFLIAPTTSWLMDSQYSPLFVRFELKYPLLGPSFVVYEGQGEGPV